MDAAALALACFDTLLSGKSRLDAAGIRKGFYESVVATATLERNAPRRWTVFQNVGMDPFLKASRLPPLSRLQACRCGIDTEYPDSRNYRRLTNTVFNGREDREENLYMLHGLTSVCEQYAVRIRRSPDPNTSRLAWRTRSS